MAILDIRGLHLEVVPFKKNNLPLFRLCFNCEVSIIVSAEKLNEICTEIFINALDRQIQGGVDSKYHSNVNNDINKAISDFIILVASDDRSIVINLRTAAKLKDVFINHIYAINKSDNKAINKFRQKLGDWV